MAKGAAGSREEMGVGMRRYTMGRSRGKYMSGSRAEGGERAEGRAGAEGGERAE